jgi:hypothetical protein
VALWTDDFSNIFKVFHLSKVVPVKRGAERGGRSDTTDGGRQPN